MRLSARKKIFRSWISEYKGLLFKVIRVYARNFEDQEDLFQEISLQLWNSIPKFKSDSKVSTWIYRVSLYTALAWHKKERKHQREIEPLRSDHQILVERKDLQNEQLEWLYEQISQLDPVNRSLILLLLDGYSYNEISQILGISSSNVGVKINRIKKQLSLNAKKL